jgi:hypothetical protein
VLPGTSKNFDQFRGDDGECRQYAYYQSGGPANEEPWPIAQWVARRSALSSARLQAR